MYVDNRTPTGNHLAEMTNYQAIVGGRLRELRRSRDLSQQEAAHRVGVAVKTWFLWETGRSAPYKASWDKIAEAFGVDTAELRGTPPDGTDELSQLDRIESQLESINDLLEGLVARLEGDRLPAPADELLRIPEDAPPTPGTERRVRTRRAADAHPDTE